MGVIGNKNQISEDGFDFMISYLLFPQKSIRSELAKLFFISVLWVGSTFFVFETFLRYRDMKMILTIWLHQEEKVISRQ